MEANPDEGKELRRKNRSFVFFHETALNETDECIGAQGVQLTPLRSAAVDKSLHVYGTPIWVEADLPIASERPVTPFRKLAIAQDTGTAIIGPARADIFFGAGEDIGKIAGRIKQFGKFVVLVPKGVTVSGAPAGVPVPAARPRT
jgi:membrane-bound lytic murein transglycosylase A